MTNPSLVYVDLQEVKVVNWLSRPFRRPQKWRWTAINGGNQRVLAVSSENYTNRQDCIDAIVQLFGDQSNVYLRQPEIGNIELRLANIQA